MAAAVAAAAIGAGSTVGAAPAYATAGQTVNFTGGSVLNVLVCKSEPSPTRLTVPAESRVMFVNRLGQTATLRVDGQAVSNVGANQAVPVVFHYGPVSVSMTFSCGASVAEKFSAATVAVQAPPRPAAPNVPNTRPAVGAANGAATAIRNAPGMSRASAVGGRQAASSGQSAPGTTEASPTAGLVDPGAVDLPSADPSAFAVDPITGETATGAAAAGTAVAVEPLVPASGAPQDGASGLLALLAAVCAVGVTIAATRAIISRRTIQARLA